MILNVKPFSHPKISSKSATPGFKGYKISQVSLAGLVVMGVSSSPLNKGLKPLAYL
jgi:hypothetical protein